MPVPIVGYVNRLSAKPGGPIEAKVSSAFAEPYGVWCASVPLIPIRPETVSGKCCAPVREQPSSG
jgi:hypothetical protein